MAATRITPQTTWQRCCLTNKWQFPLSPSNEKRNRPSPHQQDPAVHSSNPPSKHASSFEAVEAQARRFHTYPPPPGPLAISPSSEPPDPRISHILPTLKCTALLFFGLAALHQALMRACLAGLNELTNYHLPSSPLPPPSPASAPIEAGNQFSQGVPFNYSCTCAHDTAFTSNTCQRRPVH